MQSKVEVDRRQSVVQENRLVSYCVSLYCWRVAKDGEKKTWFSVLFIVHIPNSFCQLTLSITTHQILSSSFSTTSSLTEKGDTKWNPSTPDRQLCFQFFLPNLIFLLNGKIFFICDRRHFTYATTCAVSKKVSQHKI